MHLKLPATPAFVQRYIQANNHENIKIPHYWSFGGGIHRWQVDSPHKGQLMQKAFLYHVFIMESTTSIAILYSDMLHDTVHHPTKFEANG